MQGVRSKEKRIAQMGAYPSSSYKRHGRSKNLLCKSSYEKSQPLFFAPVYAERIMRAITRAQHTDWRRQRCPLPVFAESFSPPFNSESRRQIACAQMAKEPFLHAKTPHLRAVGEFGPFCPQ
jgi:hypothetical protein